MTVVPPGFPHCADTHASVTGVPVRLTLFSAREKQIITLRFGLGGREEKTQKEVADLMGISQSYISRLEKRIIVRLKKEILKMS